MFKFNCVFPSVARLDRRRAEGSCLDERHCLAGVVYRADLLLYFCILIVKVSLVCRNLDIDLPS